MKNIFATSYIDSNPINGIEYCYKIKVNEEMEWCIIVSFVCSCCKSHLIRYMLLETNYNFPICLIISFHLSFGNLGPISSTICAARYDPIVPARCKS